MTDFLELAQEEQAEILTSISSTTGRSAQILQKDVWVCWALKDIFSIPSSVGMVFKGGTSLSKAFSIIHRFSEDVDITLDHRDFPEAPDPFAVGLSKTQVKKIGGQLTEQAGRHVRNVLYPALSESFRQVTAGKGQPQLTVDCQEIDLIYPSALGGGQGYIEDKIKIEFGGRNAVEPNVASEIIPYLAEHVPTLNFPTSSVEVLAPERTFWEKATLIHVECHRPGGLRRDRISRHWYDLAMLAKSDVGERALANVDLLADVLKYKNKFFNSSYANYDACLDGGFLLVPIGDSLVKLEADYKAMIEARMFEETPRPFEEILAVLSVVESKINT